VTGRCQDDDAVDEISPGDLPPGLLEEPNEDLAPLLGLAKTLERHAAPPW